MDDSHAQLFSVCESMWAGKLIKNLLLFLVKLATYHKIRTSRAQQVLKKLLDVDQSIVVLQHGVIPAIFHWIILEDACQKKASF